jgi:hypothetical protein
MFGRKQKDQSLSGNVDGGAGRGIPLGGHDNRPPTGYRNSPGTDESNDEWDDSEFGFSNEGDPADRRKDPLRQ